MLLLIVGPLALFPAMPEHRRTFVQALGLTATQLEFFNENGYLEIPDFWTKETCDALIGRANTLVEDWEPEAVSVFSTNEQVLPSAPHCFLLPAPAHIPVFTRLSQTRTSDDHFLESGDKITCFFEEKAFGEDGELTVPKAAAINKIGHGMRSLTPTSPCNALYMCAPPRLRICLTRGFRPRSHARLRPLVPGSHVHSASSRDLPLSGLRTANAGSEHVHFQGTPPLLCCRAALSWVASPCSPRSMASWCSNPLSEARSAHIKTAPFCTRSHRVSQGFGGPLRTAL